MRCLTSNIHINLVLIASFLIVNCSANCKTKSENEKECTSIQDVKNGEVDPNVTLLRIKRSNGATQTITEDSFNNVPNITKVIFEGSVKKIDKNSFSGLEKLKDIQFFNNDLREFPSYAFNNTVVQELILYTSNVKQLKPKCFENLKNLKRIYVHKNSITIIQAGVFSHSIIENLYLNENGIRIIEDEAFFGMAKLRSLALERNFLTYFDSYRWVGTTSPNLHLLWLARNNLTRMDNELLRPFPRLKVLLMHINNIDMIADNTFNGVNDLRYIDLSNNKLTSLSHRVFPWEGLEHMDILFIQNNRLISLSTDVIAKLPRLAKIAIGGNPWLCPCYQNLRKYLMKKQIVFLCDEEYLDGKRPVCVSPEKQTENCNPSVENSDSLYDFYYSAQMDYVKLPPLCKVFCTPNTSCYSHDFDVLSY